MTTPASSSANRTAAEVNREFYDQPLPGRDDYWRKMAAPRFRVEVLMGLIEQLSPRHVVDLGSGGGQLLSEIHARHGNIKLSGVDLSAAQVAANGKTHPDVAWYVADLDRAGGMPDALAGSCDVVIASELIEHLDHPESLLENARTLARAGSGRLLLSTQSGPVRQTEQRVGHRRHWTRDEMKRALTGAGFTPVRVWNCGFPFHDLSKWYANRDPEGSMKRFAGKPYGLREDLVCYALRALFRANSRGHGAQLFAVAQRSPD